MNRLRHIGIIILLATTSLTLFAQDEEQEAAAATSAYQALRESSESLGFGNLNKVVKPVQKANGMWTTEAAKVSPMKLNYAPRSTQQKASKRTSSNSNNRTTSNHHAVGTHNRTVRTARPQIDYAALARKRQQENRRKDNEAKMRTMANYNAAMAGYRAQSAARDQYMATTGAARLDAALRSENFIQIPQEEKFQQSGKELAEKLEGKEQSISVEILTSKEYDRRYRNGQTDAPYAIDTYQDGAFDQAEADRWTAMLNQDHGTVVLPQKLKQYKKNTNFRVILSANQIDLDSTQISVLDGMGLVALYDDTLTLLCDSNLTTFSWNAEGYEIEQVVNAGRHLIAKSGNSILDFSLLDGSIDTLAVMEFDYFSLAAHSEKEVLISTLFEDLSVIQQLDIHSKEITEKIRTPYYVQKTTSSAKFHSTMALVEFFRIVDISKAPCYSYYISDESINDIAYCHAGLLVATDTNILLINTTKKKIKPYVLINIGATRLWVDRNHIYAQDTENNLIEIHHNK